MIDPFTAMAAATTAYNGIKKAVSVGREISAMTGVSINTALGRMRYALINMRKIAGSREYFS